MSVMRKLGGIVCAKDARGVTVSICKLKNILYIFVVTKIGRASCRERVSPYV